MSASKNATEIARDTLRRLAAARIAPTPDNYRRVYQEIVGNVPLKEAGEYPLLQDAIGAIDDTGLRGTTQKIIDKVLDTSDPDATPKAFTDLVKLLTDTAKATQSAPSLPGSWKEDITALLLQWDREHAGWTRARKRKSIEHALIGSSRNPDRIFTRLRSAMMQWKESAEQPASAIDPASSSYTDTTGETASMGVADSNNIASPPSSAQEITSGICECLAIILDGPLPLLLTHAPDLASQAKTLANQARKLNDSDGIHKLVENATTLAQQISVETPGDTKLRESLLALLRLLIENMHALLSGDQWLQGQLEVVQQVLGQPLSVDSIADAENAVRGLMVKQVALRQTVESARNDLKDLVRSFLDRLSGLASSTDDYQEKLQDYTMRIEKSDDIQSLGSLLKDLIADTHSMQETTRVVRNELSVAHHRVEDAEIRIREMQQELAKMTERTREDVLTGVMNRRGLDDAFQSAAARADAAGKSLCVALVDIDNFKVLNDRLGHLAGDAALRHLVDVVGKNLRERDCIARYGGEEFVLLLPDTDATAAVDIMTRLQRLLTKHFFLYKQERTLITFSCGTAMREPGERLDSVLERADKAMYSAKQAGKNRVVAADTFTSDPATISLVGRKIGP